MMAARFLGRAVFVRELLPQDLKLEVDQLTVPEAVRCAQFLASVVGRAHGRQMQRRERTQWRKELHRRHTRQLDAPSWLWTSVVDLIANHEAAYLDHCRAFARPASRTRT